MRIATIYIGYRHLRPEAQHRIRRQVEQRLWQLDLLEPRRPNESTPAFRRRLRQSVDRVLAARSLGQAFFVQV